MDIKYIGSVQLGKIKLDEAKDFLEYARSFEGQKIEIILRKYRTTRSGKQNNYYWKVIIPIIAEWVGEADREAIHIALKEKFLITRDNKGLKILQSTTQLNTTEFEIYVSRVKQWASENGLIIPDPKKITY